MVSSDTCQSGKKPKTMIGEFFSSSPDGKPKQGFQNKLAKYNRNKTELNNFTDTETSDADRMQGIPFKI